MFIHQKLLKHQYTKPLLILCSLLSEIYSLWFYRSARFKAKERVRKCKDYVTGREITTILKVAVDSVTLELCGSHDYFDSSLLVKKTDLIVTLKREGFCL